MERHRESKACVQLPLDDVPVQQAVVRQHWHQGETLAAYEHSASRGALAPERASPLAAVVALILRSARRRMVSGGVQAQARRAHGSELSWRRTAPLGLRSRAAPGAHHVALVHPYILVVLEVGQATHRKVNAHAFSALLCDGVQLWASISQCAHSATQRRSSDRTVRARTRFRLRRSWQRPRSSVRLETLLPRAAASLRRSSSRYSVSSAMTNSRSAARSSTLSSARRADRVETTSGSPARKRRKTLATVLRCKHSSAATSCWQWP